jgi:hypothetical protein
MSATHSRMWMRGVSTHSMSEVSGRRSGLCIGTWSGLASRQL